jgi:alpha-L-fucosidase
MRKYFIFLIILMVHCNDIARTMPPDSRLEWWDNARFGMFIHWGLYSIPAGIWNNEEIEELGEWIILFVESKHFGEPVK